VKSQGKLKVNMERGKFKGNGKVKVKVQGLAIEALYLANQAGQAVGSSQGCMKLEHGKGANVIVSQGEGEGHRSRSIR
jgi:hypothetical protein